MKTKKTIHPMFAKFAKPRQVAAEELSLPLAFQYGHATHEHAFILADMVNTIMVAGKMHRDNELAKTGDELAKLVRSIEDRHKKTGKYGVNSDELQTMKTLVYQFDEWMKTLPEFTKKRISTELILFYAERGIFRDPENKNNTQPKIA